jgi:hypothetical protein
MQPHTDIVLALRYLHDEDHILGRVTDYWGIQIKIKLVVSLTTILSNYDIQEYKINLYFDYFKQ